MSKKSSREIAEHVRQVYRNKRRQLASADMDNDLKPVVVDAIIDPKDGTLDRKALDAALVIKIPKWTFLPVDEDENVDIYLELSKTEAGNYHRVDNWHHVGIIDPSIFPLRLSIPVSELVANGPLLVRYHKVDNSADSRSTPVKLICDSLPPWGLHDKPTHVQFASPVIDEQYLLENKGVFGTLPPYNFSAPGDIYEIFYLSEWPQDGAVYNNPTHSQAVPATRTVFIPAEVVRELGDGRFYIVYYLLDKAGNKSRLSTAATLDITLGALPENLQEPRVPLATKDDPIDPIDLKDAILGVTVEIDRYENARSLDRIQVFWGKQQLTPETVAGRPFPIIVHVPKEALYLDYKGSVGAKKTTVSYIVLRGDVAFPPVPLETTVDVDFSVVGPERPDPDPTWPNPINPDLLAPTVRGKISGLNNKLTRADEGENALVSFPMYANAFDGQVVDIYYADSLAVQHIVNPGDGPIVTLEIPWQKILDAGNHAALPVYYTVRAGLDALNEQQSVVQYIEADAVTKRLPLPSYQGITDRNWLNCTSLNDPFNPTASLALRVEIPDLSSHLKVGDHITLHWQPFIGSSEAHGTDPVPGAELATSIILDDNNINGFVWRVEPYDIHLLPTFNHPTYWQCRARVRYALADDSVTSDWLVCRISLVQGEGSCVLPIP
ncbi:hypothetical protein D3C79_390270 [compost metagenome]